MESSYNKKNKYISDDNVLKILNRKTYRNNNIPKENENEKEKLLEKFNFKNKQKKIIYSNKEEKKHYRYFSL